MVYITATNQDNLKLFSLGDHGDVFVILYDSKL